MGNHPLSKVFKKKDEEMKMKENKVRERMRGCKWETKKMADYKGYLIFKDTEKNIGEVDKVSYKVYEPNQHDYRQKFETLKEAREYAKKLYAREQRLEKGYQKFIAARDEWYKLNKDEGYIWGLYKM